MALFVGQHAPQLRLLMLRRAAVPAVTVCLQNQGHSDSGKLPRLSPPRVLQMESNNPGGWWPGHYKVYAAPPSWILFYYLSHGILY
eukprot:CAMPEP_0177760984 /NCGR_PEP_ID=MMETSP0491_2-20121128/5561_1 /TAXON_ID=63592 /ORGANISM="Tetraselmis chuii, Strain PLY429" /LENGTH=85 /DNA_ID=CAMNT_0019276925 /DNA_START=377 /DNA_END=634 /DNA_ORIENTATION=-